MSISAEETDLVRLLARTVKGPVLDPGSDGFAGETAAFNLAADNQPAIAVGATEAADVAAAVRAAAERGLPVSVQSTGHGATAGVREGVMLCTRRMNGLQLDPERRTARVEAGVVWRQVIEAAAPYGLAPLNGSSSGVGVTGFATGGGLPLIGRPFGFAADHVCSLEMVTADGAIRHVDASSDPELFWAVRGGGGGFGIVTSMEIDLVPVRTIYGGSIYFPGEAAEHVLHAYCEWTAAAPDEMTTAITLLRLPDLPDIPPPLAGRLSVSLRVAYTGGAAAGERLLSSSVLAAQVLVKAERHVVAGDPAGARGQDASETETGRLGSASADVDDHLGHGSEGVDAGPQGAGDRLRDHGDVAETGFLGGLDESAALERRRARRHSQNAARAQSLPRLPGHLAEDGDHEGAGRLEVGDDAVMERPSWSSSRPASARSALGRHGQPARVWSASGCSRAPPSPRVRRERFHAEDGRPPCWRSRGRCRSRSKASSTTTCQYGDRIAAWLTPEGGIGCRFSRSDPRLLGYFRTGLSAPCLEVLEALGSPN